MRRRGLRLVALLAAVPCLAVTAAWAESYRRPFRVPWDAWAATGRQLRVESMSGSLYFRRISASAPVSPATPLPSHWSEAPDTGHALLTPSPEGLFGLWTTGSYATYRLGRFVTYREFRLRYGPLWFLTLPGLLVGVWAYLQIRRERQLAKVGRCARCGYDLRATPGRCPECGAVPAKD